MLTNSVRDLCLDCKESRDAENRGGGSRGAKGG